MKFTWLLLGMSTPAQPLVSEKRQRDGNSLKKRDRGGLIFGLSLLLVIIGGLFFLKTTVIGLYKAPSASMETALLKGDHFLVNYLAYIRDSPARGDVIVFRYPKNEAHLFVKRVIAVGGESVELVNGKVVIDGQLLKKNYGFCIGPAHPGGPTPSRNFGPVTVPPSALFVMGDNRDRSNDSRSWGFVQEDKVLGRAIMIYWSEHKGAARLERIGSR